MGKLNIAHHKSYHPYRQDNILRVKRDEEEARLKEAQEADRALLAESEARIVALRQRAGVEGQVGESPEVAGPSASTIASGASLLPPPSTSSLTSGGNKHINLFEDIEQQSVALSVRTSKKAAHASETEKGVPLAPTKKDLRPWYSSREGNVDKDEDYRKEEQRRMRDLARKSVADPIATIPAHISKPSNSSSRDRRSSSKPAPVSEDPNVSARLSRESSERARAQALIARRKREMEGSVTATPSTVHGGSYRDVFNPDEVEAAHRYRDRDWGDRDRRGWRDQGWNEDVGRGRR